MFKIGDFSKFSRVPVKTLRYYDEIGLLVPASVDASNGYRYYTLDQLARLNRILALRDLGFSLDQIARLLESELSSSYLRETLLMKRTELQERVREEQARLARVEARLQQIEEEKSLLNYDVVIKHTQPQLIVSLRATIASYQDVGQLFATLYKHIAHHGLCGGLCGAIWHDSEYRTCDIDAEALVFIDRMLPSDDQVKCYELPTASTASLVYHGSYATLNQAYIALFDWIEHNNYRAVGATYEYYLSGTGQQDGESCITELQVPIIERYTNT